MNDIKSLGERYWLVHGKVLGFPDGCMDGGLTEEKRAAMVDVADNTCGSPMFPRRDVPCYAACFKHAPASTGKRFVFVGQPHFRELPDPVKEILRREVPEHASEF